MGFKINKKLTTFDLKVIGLVLMVLDHVHQTFSGSVPGWFDFFGRPVATIFFFVSVEGFIHTSNKTRYLRRLLYGFWIMSIGNLIVGSLFSDGDIALTNNIFGDIFIGVSAIYGLNKIIEGLKLRKYLDMIMGLIIATLPILMSAGLAALLTNKSMLVIPLMTVYPSVSMAENGIFCYLIVILYLLRKSRGLQCLAIAITSVIYTGYISTNWQFNDLLTQNTQWAMIFAILPIIFYNSQRGKSMKMFFYIFYPTHLWVLYILASFINK